MNQPARFDTIPLPEWSPHEAVWIGRRKRLENPAFLRSRVEYLIQSLPDRPFRGFLPRGATLCPTPHRTTKSNGWRG